MSSELWQMKIMQICIMIVADFQTLDEGKFGQSNNYQELKNPSNMAPLNIIKNFSFSEH